MARPRFTIAPLSLLFPFLAAAQTCNPGFQSGEPAASGIFDSFSAYVQPMTEYQGNLVIGGAFSAAGPIATKCVAAFNPSTNTWSALGGGADLGNTNGFGAALASFSVNGISTLYFGGSFAAIRNANGTNVSNSTSIAAWNGSQWSSLNTNWLPATGRSVWTLLDWQPASGQRRLVVGGGFPFIGTATAAGIATFDGVTFSNIGGPTDTGIAGSFSPVVFCSAVYNGMLYIGGRFDSVNGISSPNIARWNGTAWQRPGVLGNGGAISDVSALTVFNDGTGSKLYAGGYDLRPGGQVCTIAAFAGVAWSRVGQNLGGRGTSLAAFNDGTGVKLYMGMTADAQEKYFYRLENNLWVPVQGGMSIPLTPNFPSVFGLYATPSALYVGGNFQMAGTQPSYGIARYTAGGTSPTITQHPAPAIVCPGGSVSFSVQASGTAPFTYQWRRNQANLSNIPNQIFGATSPTLQIILLSQEIAGDFDCIVTNSCNSATSNSAALSICAADFNCDSSVDFFDYLDFVQAFADNSSAADFNHDSVIDFFDYLDFVQTFSTGC